MTTFAKHFEWNDDTQYTMNTVALEQTGRKFFVLRKPLYKKKMTIKVRFLSSIVTFKCILFF